MSSTQQEASPEQQRTELAKLAEKLGATITAEYLDEGVSGVSTHKRRGFKQLLTDAVAGKFSIILAWDQDRFSRLDSIDSGEIIAPLRRAGVRLVTCGQGEIDWDSFAGRLVFNVAQEGKNAFLHDLSRNMCRSLLQRGQKGEQLSKPPFGYERIILDDRGAEVRRVRHGETFRKPRGWTCNVVPAENPAIVEAVRWLFTEFAKEDSSLISLATELNRRGLLTSRGKAWRHDSVADILSNPFYCGTYTFGKTSRAKFNQVSDDGSISKAAGGKRRKRPPVVTIDDHHAPLIDRETFDRVQAKLESRKLTHRKPRSNSYPLSGVLKCGHCGGAMSGRTDTSGRWRYYSCFNGSRGKCPNGNFQPNADTVEKLVCEFVRQQAAEPAKAKYLADKVLLETKRRATAKPAASKAAQAQLDRLEACIERGQENLLLADPADVAACQKLLAKWRTQRDSLRASLDAPGKVKGQQPADAEGMAARAMAKLAELQAAITSGNVSVARAAFHEMFAKISVFAHRKQDGEKRRYLARVVLETTDALYRIAGNRT